MISIFFILKIFRNQISLLKRSLLIIPCVLLMHQAFSQTYALPDTNFRNSLLKKHPYLMTGNELNLAAANAFTNGLDIDSANISDASGLQFFVNATSINLNANKLTSIPQIAGLNKLMFLFLAGNQLTSLPNLSGMTSLYDLQIQNNPISALPPSFSSLSNLRNFYAVGCQLTSLPNLSTLTNLEVLIVSLNPDLKTLPDLSALVNLKQLHLNVTGVDTIPGLSSLVNLEQLHCWNNHIRSISGLSSGPKLTYLLVQDNPLGSIPNLSAFPNLKELHVNNTGIDTLPGLSSLMNLEELHCSGNKIKSISGMNANTKLRWLVVNNNLLSSLPTLSNKPWLFGLNVKMNRLTFEDLLPLTSMPFFNGYEYSPQQMVGAEDTFTIRKNESFQLKLAIDPLISSNWYKWYKNGILLDSNQTGIRNFDPIDFSDAGVYSVVVTNPSLPSLTLKSYNWNIKIIDCEGCSAVFSPDGDGVIDTYKIEESGLARIYNLGGTLIKEIPAPGEWDGTDSNGSLADAGYYAIIINGRKTINVSLMR